MRLKTNQSLMQVDIELDGREVKWFLNILQHARNHLHRQQGDVGDRDKELLLIARLELGVEKGSCDYPYLSEFREPVHDDTKSKTEHAAMRRALYEVVWIVTHPPKGNARARQCPELSDEEIKTRLKELING